MASPSSSFSDGQTSPNKKMREYLIDSGAMETEGRIPMEEDDPIERCTTKDQLRKIKTNSSTLESEKLFKEEGIFQVEKLTQEEITKHFQNADGEPNVFSYWLFFEVFSYNFLHRVVFGPFCFLGFILLQKNWSLVKNLNMEPWNPKSIFPHLIWACFWLCFILKVSGAVSNKVRWIELSTMFWFQFLSVTTISLRGASFNQKQMGIFRAKELSQEDLKYEKEEAWEEQTPEIIAFELKSAIFKMKSDRKELYLSFLETFQKHLEYEEVQKIYNELKDTDNIPLEIDLNEEDKSYHWNVVYFMQPFMLHMLKLVQNKMKSSIQLKLHIPLAIVTGLQFILTRFFYFYLWKNKYLGQMNEHTCHLPWGDNAWDLVFSVLCFCVLAYSFIQPAKRLLLSHIDLQRSIFLGGHLLNMIAPQKHVAVDDSKLFPTINICCPLSLKSWLTMTQAMLQYGKKHISGVSFLCSIRFLYIVIRFFIVGGFAMGVYSDNGILFFEFLPYQIPNLVVAISLELVSFFLFVLKFEMLGAQLNSWYDLVTRELSELCWVFEDIWVNADLFFDFEDTEFQEENEEPEEAMVLSAKEQKEFASFGSKVAKRFAKILWSFSVYKGDIKSYLKNIRFQLKLYQNSLISTLNSERITLLGFMVTDKMILLWILCVGAFSIRIITNF